MDSRRGWRRDGNEKGDMKRFEDFGPGLGKSPALGLSPCFLSPHDNNGQEIGGDHNVKGITFQA